MKREPWFCQDCRIVMFYNEKEDYHICPKCLVRVYHSDEKDDYLNDEVRKLMQDMYKTHVPKEILPQGRPTLKGGSKCKGRSRKQDMKKPSLAQINIGLAGTAKQFESR